MIGCSELKLPVGTETAIFSIGLVDVNNSPITNETFAGSIVLSIGFNESYNQIEVSTVADNSKLNAYFNGSEIIIVIPPDSQSVGEVYYSFLLSGKFALSNTHGAELINYETIAKKLCNFV